MTIMLIGIRQTNAVVGRHNILHSVILRDFVINFRRRLHDSPLLIIFGDVPSIHSVTRSVSRHNTNHIGLENHLRRWFQWFQRWFGNGSRQKENVKQTKLAKWLCVRALHLKFVDVFLRQLAGASPALYCISINKEPEGIVYSWRL